MNFATEKMAKSLELPGRVYLVELQKQKPILFQKVKSEYDQGFNKFFTEIAARLKIMISKEINIVTFVENCAKEFQRRNELEKELSMKRIGQLRTVVSSDSEDYMPKKVRIEEEKHVRVSSSETLYQDIKYSGTVNKDYSELRDQYVAMETNYKNLATRYEQCKALLNNEMNENKRLALENEMLKNEIARLKNRCVCSQMEELLQNRLQ